MRAEHEPLPLARTGWANAFGHVTCRSLVGKTCCRANGGDPSCLLGAVGVLMMRVRPLFGFGFWMNALNAQRCYHFECRFWLQHIDLKFTERPRVQTVAPTCVSNSTSQPVSQANTSSTQSPLLGMTLHFRTPASAPFRSSDMWSLAPLPRPPLVTLLL